MQTGELLGSGRSADVFAIDDAWVVRRCRDGSDVAAESAVLAHLHDHGYPVPRVRAPGAAGTDARTESVLERLTGPTLLQSLLRGDAAPGEAGVLLGRLLRRLHAVPARIAAGPTDRILHLDLHPDNVMLTPGGPMVIDWSHTEEGSPGLDWAMSALILAQVAVGGDAVAGPARVALASLLEHAGAALDLGDAAGGCLARARARRAANPTMSATEVGLLDEAVALVLALRRGGARQ